MESSWALKKLKQTPNPRASNKSLRPLKPKAEPQSWSEDMPAESSGDEHDLDGARTPGIGINRELSQPRP